MPAHFLLEERGKDQEWVFVKLGTGYQNTYAIFDVLLLFDCIRESSPTIRTLLKS